MKRITLDMIKPERRDDYTQADLDAGLIIPSDLISSYEPTQEEYIGMGIIVSEYHQKVTEASALSIGKYGSMRLKHLQEHKPDIYARMILDETLLEHCMEIDQSVTEMIETERWKLEHLKDQTAEYVGQCIQIESRIVRELVYTE